MARRREPKWLTRAVLDAVHTDQVREHGGLTGIRDENALESALHRAPQTWAYDDSADLAALAAAYGFALVRNHPFRDGNKRLGFLALATFLGINGVELKATDAEIVTMVVGLAAGDVTEEQLAAWIRGRMRSSRND